MLTLETKGSRIPYMVIFAALALQDYEQDAETIGRKAMEIAASICVYTNGNLTVEALDA